MSNVSEPLEMLDVRLGAPSESLSDLSAFYCDHLGLESVGASDRLVIRVGASRLEFTATSDGSEPFYHFALLVPGNRFSAAYTWLAERVGLLADPDSGDTHFDFAAWDADACYCHDPVGNIVELIAHNGLDETRHEGRPFHGRELVGFSEVGLVGGDKTAATTLARDLDLHVWDGTLDDPQRLAFVGERGRTLILCPAGRPWLPTGRPAEMHPVEVAVAGMPGGAAVVPGTPHRVSRRAGP